MKHGVLSIDALLVKVLGSMKDGAMMGDQREFDLETRVTTNGNNKTPRCFTVVH